MHGSPKFVGRLAMHTASRRLQPHKARPVHTLAVWEPLSDFEMLMDPFFVRFLTPFRLRPLPATWLLLVTLALIVEYLTAIR